MSVSRRVRIAAAILLGLSQVGWSQYRTSMGLPVHWLDPEVPVRLDQSGTTDVEGDAEFTAIRKSLATWNQVDCPHPQLADKGFVSGITPCLGPKCAGTNVVLWEDEATWTKLHPATGADPVTLRTIALTTLFYNDSTGAADSFDLELNGFRFHYSVTDDPDMAQTDVENTITHELGHVLALDHSSDPEATMYYSATTGDMWMRTLGEDDLAGLCTIYSFFPSDEDATPDASEETGGGGGGGGCTAGRSAPSPALAIVASLPLLLYPFASRRRSRRQAA
jgi:hypothetical protein